MFESSPDYAASDGNVRARTPGSAAQARMLTSTVTSGVATATLP
jgi:hypothetical protein